MGYPGWAYDLFMKPLDAMGLRAARRRLLGGLRGRALELGAGTGLNLQAAPDHAAQVVAIDRDIGMLKRVRPRSPAALLVCADAHALPFREGVFDVALEALVFCSLARPADTLAELRRVLKRGGELRMLDHVRAPGAVLARIQDVMAPAWLKATRECHLNREVAPLLSESGWTIEKRVTRARGVLEEIVARA